MREDLPTGTVTFLFTDVEGSTKLLQSLRAEAYAAALAEHRRTIREACAAEGGVEVDTQGDAFFFAFAKAPGALAAAAAFTDALASGPIQVRVGLHTGTPVLTDEGYVGEDVHLGARVAASSHGGQIVLSRTTASLVEAELVDLGEHRLKDIDDPVPLHQLGAGVFPPLKTISNTNLPRPASSFVGRELELAEVLARIERGARLVTLSGPGGTGKTRLALEAALTLVPRYSAGVFWVGLASLHDPTLVIDTIARVLGARDDVASHIAEREMLVLLDNLEQVVDASPELAKLLTACPNLTLLVTSRELMRVQGEVEYSVPPLAELEAVSLFCERAQLDSSAEIAELCARVDHLPLAVELAAARTKALTPAQILERLSGTFDLLQAGRDADPRQQTLRATIEWSYELLTPEERRVFARLSVFGGGCTVKAAEEVCEADLETLQSLVEKSLLRFSNARYWMLETLREYASSRLAEFDAGGELPGRHAAHFTALAETASKEWQGEQHDDWVDRLESERANVRSALTWARRNDGELALRLAVAFTSLWLDHGPLLEAVGALEHALEAAPDAPPETRARALRNLSICQLRLGDAGSALVAAEASLAFYRRSGRDVDIAMVLLNVGESLSQLGKPHDARERFDDAIQLLRSDGTDLQVGRALISLGYLELTLGNLERAAELLEDGADHMRRTSLPWELAYALLNLGSSRLALGDIDGAAGQLHESLALFRWCGEPVGHAYSVEALGILKERLTDYAGAVSLLGAADRMFRDNGVVMQSFELDLHQASIASLKEALGATGFDDAWARGAELTDDEVASVVNAPPMASG